jgi:uroporphyrin-III C-methyltransferase/precorrin-2 dehydrogenase/sirohydrochlorin ferrochelatase/uroporphyrin-III C-methyltransferase
MQGGCVYLVGAGPGDPDLLTVKALRVIQSADVVVLDRLVSQPIADLIPVGTSQIFAGKETGQHQIEQGSINALLVRLARSGRTVVRLKGGDPFMFGRGGEEAAYLGRHGVVFEVVPGITAAAGCSAYAGIPLTHRDWARTVRIITGHAKDGDVPDYDWPTLADGKSTLVIYMGLANLARIAAALMTAGLSAGTPAAAIENGTTRTQRRVLAAVGSLAEEVGRAGLVPPTLIIIGDVVSLADSVDWFQPVAAPAMEARPLQARGVAG